MGVTKEQIINGTLKYVSNEVMPNINDIGFRIISEAIIELAMSQKKFDFILENELVKSMATDDNGMYCIEKVEESLVNSINRNGNLQVNLGGIKFISPDSKRLSFNAEDIHKLKEYIANA